MLFLGEVGTFRVQSIVLGGPEPIREVEVPLRAGLTALYGLNGAGKTRTLEGIAGLLGRSGSAGNYFRVEPDDTVAGLAPCSAAISVLVLSLSAHARTIRQRRASAWDDERRRSQRSKVFRSLPDRMICTVGRPRRAIAVPSHVGRYTPTNAPQPRKFPEPPNILRTSLTAH